MSRTRQRIDAVRSEALEIDSGFDFGLAAMSPRSTDTRTVRGERQSREYKASRYASRVGL